MIAIVTVACLATQPAAPTSQEVPSVRLRVGELAPNGAVITELHHVASNDIGGWATLGIVGNGDPTDCTNRNILGTLNGGSVQVLAECWSASNGFPVIGLGRDGVVHIRDVGLGLLCTGFVSRALFSGNDYVACLNELAPNGTGISYPHDLQFDAEGHLVMVQELEAPLNRDIHRIRPYEPVLVAGTPVLGSNFRFRGAKVVALTPRSSHYGARARVYTSLAGPFPEAAVVDGRMVVNDGEFVMIGRLVVPSDGPSSRRWFRIGSVVMDAYGSTWISGLDDGPPSTRGFVLRDGEVVMRRGDIVDGLELVGNCLGVIPGADGSVAILWSATDGTGPGTVTIFVDGRRAIWQGQPIDIDGDGQADPGATVVSGLEANDVNYGHVDINEDSILRVVTPTSDPQGSSGPQLRRAFVELQLPLGRALCDGPPTSTGAPARMSMGGSSRIERGGLDITVESLAVGSVGYVLGSRSAGTGASAVSCANGLCLAGEIGRHTSQLAMADASGTLAVQLQGTQLTQPSGFVAALVGETWHFQLWFRDASIAGGSSCLSSARSIRWR